MNLSVAVPIIKTRVELEAVLAQMAKDYSKSKLRCAERDLEITKVRDRYKDVDVLSLALANGDQAVTDWAESNKKEFPTDKRSIEARHGTLRFRLGNPRLVPLKGWTLKSVLEKMQAGRKRFGLWLKTTEALDLQGLLKAARAEKKPLTKKFLASAGLALHQDDAFSFELHQETPAP